MNQHTRFPIEDSGSVDMSASGISLTVGVVVGADAKGHATLSTKTCSFNVGHLSVKFHGGARFVYSHLCTYFLVDPPINNFTEGVLFIEVSII